MWATVLTRRDLKALMRPPPVSQSRGQHAARLSSPILRMGTSWGWLAGSLADDGGSQESAALVEHALFDQPNFAVSCRAVSECEPAICSTAKLDTARPGFVEVINRGPMLGRSLGPAPSTTFKVFGTVCKLAPMERR